MPIARRNLLRLATGVLASGVLVLGSATTAQAKAGVPDYRAASSFQGHAPTISVNVTTDAGFSLPSHVRSGFVTFKVSTPEPTYHGFQGFRLKNGASVATVLEDFRLGVAAETAEENAAGARGLLQHSTLVGGVVTSSFAPISVTVPLEPGTYYFFDLNDFFNGVAPRIHTLVAVGQPHWSGLPRFSQVILTVMNSADQPRFVAPTDQSATGTFLVVNPADEIHEAVWRSVKPGTTDEYIQQYYDAFLAGHPIARPWLDIQHGLQAMSPERFAVIHIDLPPGLYAMLCLVPSDESGLPHAYIGMHQVVTLH
jgi:hypothetical protein